MAADHPLAGRRYRRCEWCLARTKVVFCITEASLKKTKRVRMPIEMDPNPDGNAEILPNTGGVPVVRIHAGPASIFDDATTIRYMPHHATCARDAIPPEDLPTPKAKP